MNSKIEIIITEDGSPTALLKNDHGVAEAMHSLKGAFSETMYVYGEAFQTASRMGKNLNVLSVGLGLGYNEFLSAAFALRNPSLIQNVVSFESQDFLIRSLLARMDLSHEIPEVISKSVYDQIGQFFAESFSVSRADLFEQLKVWHATHVWNTLPAWTPVGAPPYPFHILLYDPFSEKMSPEFWSEDCIDVFLQTWCASQCVLSTYAAKGVLNRGLKRHGFQLQDRPGFGGKKQCTLAIRGFC